jgi:hypothetical protein
MDRFEEKIIDLVDVISDPDADRPKEANPNPTDVTIKASPTIMEHSDLESMVRKEVDLLIRSTIQENIQKMIKEVLIQEVEKAVAREIETLKRR